MPGLEFIERPSFKRTTLILAFSGWPDASEAATGAVRHLVDTLGATLFATIDPEDFFDFTQARPEVTTEPDGGRTITWPGNQFYHWKSSHPEERDIVFATGAEPHLKWRQFSRLFMEVVDFCDVQLMITVGALLDAVPHTRPPRVTASATTHELGPGLEHIKLEPSRYEGPTGMTSVLLSAMSARGIPCASIWGHAPHYVQVSPNPSITLAILKRLEPLFPAPIDLSELETSGAEFSENLMHALADETEITGYVRRLEERYDSEVQAVERPDPEALMKDLEAFLKRQRSNGEGDAPRE